MEQQIDGGGEDGVEVVLEAGPANRGRCGAAFGLKLSGFGLHLVVELVAIGGGGAAGSPAFAVEGDEAGLVGGLVATAAADEDRTADEGQFMILLEKEDEAVGEFDAARLHWLERVQGGDDDLLPWLGGFGCGGGLGWCGLCRSDLRDAADRCRQQERQC